MRKNSIIILVIILANIAISASPEDSYSQMEVVVVVHKSRPTLSESQIRLIFTGYMTTWPNGDKIRVMINRDTSLKEKFFYKYLNISTTQFNSIWAKKKIRDGISPPREGSSDVIKTLVASSPKYIGFIQGSELNSSLKVAAP